MAGPSLDSPGETTTEQWCSGRMIRELHKAIWQPLNPSLRETGTGNFRQSGPSLFKSDLQEMCQHAVEKLTSGAP